MIKLKTEQVRQFKNQASGIKQNPTQPILNFLKLSSTAEECRIIKNNLLMFVIKQLDSDFASDFEDMLVDSKVLFDFCENSSQEFVQLTNLGGKIHIFDGATNAYSPTDEVSKYPLNDKAESEWIEILPDVINTISIAAKVIDEDDPTNLNPRSCVFVGPEVVGGTNGFIGYFKLVNSKLPRIILSRSIAQAVGELPIAVYSENQSYNFFKGENILYGFVKTEMPFYDCKPFFNQADYSEGFSLNKEKFMQFNRLASSINTSKLISASFKPTELPNQLKLEMIDADYASCDRVIEYEGLATEFKFNPSYMNTLLSSLPSSDIAFFCGQKKYYITDKDRSFLALVMQII